MTKTIIKGTHLLGIFAIAFLTSASADGVISKQVYSFKTEDGTTVFTDKQPIKTNTYETHTIEAANSTLSNVSTGDHYITQADQNVNITQTQTQKIIIAHKNKQGKKHKVSKKSSTSRCQSYKEKLEYYAAKMRSGYINSEYKKLEKSRKKYRNLLFSRCETKTFSD